MEIILEQFLYDTLGRVAQHTNALQGVTVYSETLVDNRLKKTVSYPDGGQRVENYYRDGRLEKVTGSAALPVRYDYGCEQDGTGGPWREFTKETKLDALGNPSLEWTKNYTDGAGRMYRTIYAKQSTPYPYHLLTYNDKNQLVQENHSDHEFRLN
jgi:hypothetical protein